MLEAYVNRDALPYLERYDIPEAKNIFRGTLRYPDHCEMWNHFIKLGLPVAIGAGLIAENRINLSGIRLPVTPEIYELVFKRTGYIGNSIQGEKTVTKHV